MSLFHRILQALDADMRVNLRRRQRLVAQKLLHRLQIRASVQ